MILATDVHYHDSGATAAGVLFNDWGDVAAQQTLTVEIATVKPYVSGQFYQRELPCLLALIEQIDRPLDCIVVDGFVYLDKQKNAGLGQYLYDALGGQVAVVGVAKSAFRDSPVDTQVLRGESRKPLYVTSVGIELVDAKRFVVAMAGDFRLPTLLKQVDSLCRQRNG
ncbi:MAG TPA: endonuclease V [Thiothrix sp.]|nr:endonuclease V [Thiothrix sp.]